MNSNHGYLNSIDTQATKPTDFEPGIREQSRNNYMAGAVKGENQSVESQGYQVESDQLAQTYNHRIE